MLPWLICTSFYFRFSWIVAFSTSTWPRQWTTTSSLLTIFKPSSRGKYNFQYPNYIFFFGRENERTSCFIFMPFTVWWKLLRNKKPSTYSRRTLSKYNASPFQFFASDYVSMIFPSRGDWSKKNNCAVAEVDRDAPPRSPSPEPLVDSLAKETAEATSVSPAKPDRSTIPNKRVKCVHCNKEVLRYG